MDNENTEVVDFETDVDTVDTDADAKKDESKVDESAEVETFTKEEMDAYIKKAIEDAKKEAEEAAKRAEEDAKLTKKEREERDFREAQAKLKLDRFTFDLDNYLSATGLRDDKYVKSLLDTESLLSKENSLDQAKTIIDNYKKAIDNAYALGKNEAESAFNKEKMQGREVFDGIRSEKIEEKVKDFDSFYNSLF